ncbi:MAG: putative Ig domain-containing protein [Rhizobium sp.]|nr:putative Ig domain-containing protein [Rhizobium sp.]
MVAVFTGNGLGLQDSSITQLGMQLQRQPGRGLQAVNLATGNLVLQGVDEMLVVRGLPISATRTYNSLGLASNVGSDGWLTGFERRVELVGALNGPGSSVRLHTGDGTWIEFVYSSGKYRATDASGAFDTLKWNTTDSTWVFTDGTTQYQEVYKGTSGQPESARLISFQKELLNPSTKYSVLYSGANVVEVRSSVSSTLGADALLFDYDAMGRLTSVSTREGGVTQEQVKYGYDAAGRLSWVEVDLTPKDLDGSDIWNSADAAANNGQIYRTTYTYDSDSLRIASVSNSDGTSSSYTYDTAGRIASITRGGETMTFAYDVANRRTDVQDGLGRTWTYTFDASGQLIYMDAPASGGVRDRTTYNYNTTNGLLIYTETRRGADVLSSRALEYDGNGNLTKETDALGNQTIRVYGTNNRLIEETVGGATTKYVYEADAQVRFIIDAAGRVTEYEYHTSGDGIGQVKAIRTFTEATYGGTADAATIETWTSTRLANSTLVELKYDAAGRLSRRVDYGSMTSGGSGQLDAATSVTKYVYDAQGLLRTQVTIRSGSRLSDTAGGTSADQVTDYVYDGMGRLLDVVSRAGNTVFVNGVTSAASLSDQETIVTSTRYEDAQSRIRITQDAGGIRVETHDAAGRVMSTQEWAPGPGGLRETHNYFDAAGQLRARQDVAGGITYYFYDERGFLVAEVSPTLTMVEYERDAMGRATKVIAHDAFLQANATAGWLVAGEVTVSDAASIRPEAVTAAGVRETIYVYDDAGRLAQESDGVATTTYQYDAAHRLIQVKVTAPGETDRISRKFYDASGQLLGELDANGYLTRYEYDSAGRQTRIYRYANPTPVTERASGTLVALTPSTASTDQLERFYYDRLGRLVGHRDAAMYLTVTTYDEVGNQRAVQRYANTVSNSASATLATLISEASVGGSRTTQYTYDNLGRLKSELNPQGTITTYHYDDAGRLIRTESAQGTTEVRNTNQLYNGLGQLIGEMGDEGTAQILPGMDEVAKRFVFAQYGTTHSYDLRGNRSESVDAQGNKTWYFYDGNGNLSYTVRGVADANGVKNAYGEVTQNVYSAFGEVTEKLTYTGRIALGLDPVRSQVEVAISALTFVASVDSRTQYFRDDRGLLVQEVSPEGKAITYLYTGFGQVRERTVAGGTAVEQTQRFAYDSRGQLVLQTEAFGVAGLERSNSLSYDAFGRVLTETDGRGVATTFGYDKLGRLIDQRLVVQGRTEIKTSTFDAWGRTLTDVNAIGQTTTYQYNDAARTLSVTTAEGMTVVTAYNRHGDVVTVTDGAGAATSYHYDAEGRLVRTTDALGQEQQRAYDIRGLLVRTTDATGTDIEYTYDALGRVLTRTEDAGGLNLVTTFTYDGQGRQVDTTDPSGLLTRTSYDRDGRVITVARDPNGLNLRTHYVWDQAGQQASVTEGYGTTAARTVVYGYNALGQRVSEAVQMNGNGPDLVTTYAYDANGNLVRRIDAEGNATRYVYDQANRLAFAIDPLGGVTRNWYDEAGRVVATRRYAALVSLSAADLSVLEDPDSVGGLALLTGKVVANDAADALQYRVLDKDGRLKYTLTSVGESAFTVEEVRYNAAGRISERLSYPNAVTVSPTLRTSLLQAGELTVSGVNTLLGNVQSLRNTQLTLASGVYSIYDAAGREIYVVTRLTSTTGHAVRKDYDEEGRVVATTSFGTSVIYDPARTAAQLATELAAVPATARRETRLAYDAIGRLRFTVDDAGAVVERRYDARGQLVQLRQYPVPVAVGTYTESYLATAVAGQSGVRITTNTYDEAGRLASTTDAAGHAESYGYDATGNRTLLTDKLGNQWHYAYDAAGRLVEERSPPVTVYRYVAGTLTSSVAAIVTAYERDGLGNVTSRTENAGTAESRTTVYEYDALGRQVRTIFPDAGQIDPITGELVASGLQPEILVVYDALGRAVAQKDTLGAFSYKVYDNAGRVVYDIDAEGYVTAYTYDAHGQQTALTRRAEKFNFSSLGSLWTPGTAISFTQAGTGSPPTTAGRELKTSYDMRGLRTAVEQPSITYWNTDGTSAQGKPRTEYQYDAFGQLVRESVLLQGAAPSAVWANTHHYYDELGRRTFSVDAEGYATAWTYDALGQETTRTEYARALNPLAVTVGTPPAPPAAGDAAIGLDRTTISTYDAMGRKLTETTLRTVIGLAGANLSRNVIQGFEYDAAGRVVATTVTQETLAGAVTQVQRTETDYDALGRAVAITEPERAALRSDWATILTNAGTDLASQAALYETVSPYTTVAYDAFGKAVRTVRHALAQVGAGTPPADENDQTSFTRYDWQGRAVIHTDGTDHRVYTAYDAADRVSHTWYDLTQGSLSGGSNVVVRVHANYDYDALGRRVSSVTSRAGSAGVDGSQYLAYNAFGEVTAEAATLAGLGDAATRRDYVYDLAGNLVSSDAEGGDRSYRYNLAGHQVAEVRKWKDGTQVHDVVTHQLLDKLGRNVGSKLPTATLSPTATHTITRTLDRWGNVLEQVDALGHVVTWTYNEQNLATSQLAPLVTVVTANNNLITARPKTEWVYDALGRLIASRDANGYIDSFAYDASGKRVSSTDSMGAVTRYAYDLLGRERIKQDAEGYLTTRGYDQMDRVRAVGDFRAASGGLRYHSMRETYLLNGQGDRVVVTDALGHKRRFDFDSRSLLVKSQSAMEETAQKGVTTHYAYDAWGNLISEGNGLGHTRTWAYDVHGRVTAQSDFGGNSRQIGYQDNGQRSSETNSLYTGAGDWRSVEYYANGLIRRIDEGDGAYTLYEYDANGNRTREEMHGSIRRVNPVTGNLENIEQYAIANTVVYDSNGRISRVMSDDLIEGTRTLMVDYQYDAVGNRRKVTALSSFGPTIKGNPPQSTNPLPNVTIPVGDADADWQWLTSSYFDEVDGDTVTYALSGPGGSPAPSWLLFSYDSLTGQMTFDVTDQSVAGVYELTVTASDMDGAASSTFTLTVDAPLPGAPVIASPIADLERNEGSVLSLDAGVAFSDPDGDPLTFAATIQKDGQSLPLSSIGLQIDSATGLITGTIPTGLADGLFTIRVTASDGPSTTSDEFVLTVNRGPTAASGTTTIAVTNQVAFSRTVAGFVDPDANEVLTYVVISPVGGAPAWLTVTQAADRSITLSGTPPVDFPGLQIVVEATDHGGLKAQQTISITGGSAPNDPPVRNMTLPDRTGQEGQGFEALLPANAFSDPNGDVLTYSAVIKSGTSTIPLSSIGLGIDASTGRIYGTISGSNLASSYTIEVTASDGTAGAFGTFTLFVQHKPVGPADYSVKLVAGQPLNHQVPAFSDVDIGSLAYSIVSPVGTSWPSWLTWDSLTHTLSGTPPTGITSPVVITVRATDPTGLHDEVNVTLSPDLGIVIVAPPPNLVAALDRPMDDTWPKIFDDTNSDSLSFQGFVMQRTYIDNDGVEVPEQFVPLNFIGLTLQAVPGNGERFRVVGTPHPLNPANTSKLQFSMQLKLVATDADGNTKEALSTVNLRYAPVLTNSQLVVSAGIPINKLVPFTDADSGDILTYTAASALPPGLTLNASSGVLSGPALPVGSYTFQVTAFDAMGVSTTATVTLVVQNDAPTAGTVATQYAYRTQAWNFSAAGVFTDKNGDTLTLSASGMPPGVSFDPATMAFSGVPTTAGSYIVTLTANDGNGGVTTKTFTVVVQEPGVNYAPVVANPITDRSAFANVSWSFTVPANTFVDPNGDTMTYSASGMPSGMTFNASTRTFSFVTPSTPSGIVYTLTVTATDVKGLSTPTTFSLWVDADEGIPPWPGPGGGGQILTKSTSLVDTTSSSSTSDGGSVGSTAAVGAAAVPEWARQQVAWYTYDAENRVKVVNGQLVNGAVETRRAGSTSARSYEAFYDNAGREIRQDSRVETEEAGQLKNYVVRHHTTYTGRGEREKQWIDRIDVQNPQGAEPRSDIEEFQYDDAGRLVKSIVKFKSKTWAYQWEGSEAVKINVGGMTRREIIYTYDDDGRLVSRVTKGREANPLVLNPQQQGDNWLNTPNDLSLLEEVRYAPEGTTADELALGYDAAGNVRGYAFEKHKAEWSEVDNLTSQDYQTYTHYYKFTYEAQSSYLEKSVTGESTNSAFKATTTTSVYDEDGRRIEINDKTPLDGDDLLSRRRLAYNADGQAILRKDHWWDNDLPLDRQVDEKWRQGQDEFGSANVNLPNILWPELTNAEWNGLNDTQREQYYAARDNLRYTYVNGQQIALQDEAGRLDAVGGLTAFSNSASGRGGVQVQAGDTLQSLARRVYGNEAYWYVLADANGLDEGSTLVAGSTLTVPEVRTSLNDANTFKPYNPADVTGPTTPSLPYIPPAAAACDPIATIVMAVVAIAVTVYTAGLATPGVTGSFFGAGLATLAGSGGAVVGLTAGAIGGFAGSVAAQAVGKAAGWVDSFSLRDAVAAGIGGGIAGGLAGAYGGSTAQLLADKASATRITGSVLGNAVGSYVGGKIAGVKDTSFSWRSIAANAVSSVLTAKANQTLGLNAEADFGGTGQIGQDVVGGLVGGVVSLHTRRLAGFDDPVNYGQILADAFGNALGNAAVRDLGGLSQRPVPGAATAGAPGSDANLLSHEQLMALGNALGNDADRSLEGRTSASPTKSSSVTLADTIKSGAGADKASQLLLGSVQVSGAAFGSAADSATSATSHMDTQRLGNSVVGGGGGAPQSGSRYSAREPLYWYDDAGTMHIGPVVYGDGSGKSGLMSDVMKWGAITSGAVVGTPYALAKLAVDGVVGAAHLLRVGQGETLYQLTGGWLGQEAHQEHLRMHAGFWEFASDPAAAISAGISNWSDDSREALDSGRHFEYGMRMADGSAMLVTTVTGGYGAVRAGGSGLVSVVKAADRAGILPVMSRGGPRFGGQIGAIGELSSQVADTALAPRTTAYATNGDFVQSIATRADDWGVRQGLGNGPVAGTLKHGYAEALLNRYQRMFGDRGLSAEVRYVNGNPWRPGDPILGSVRLDVVEGPLTSPTHVWDYKFGNAILSQPQITRIQNGIPSGTSVPVTMVKP